MKVIISSGYFVWTRLFVSNCPILMNFTQSYFTSVNLSLKKYPSCRLAINQWLCLVSISQIWVIWVMTLGKWNAKNWKLKIGFMPIFICTVQFILIVKWASVHYIDHRLHRGVFFILDSINHLVFRIEQVELPGRSFELNLQASKPLFIAAWRVLSGFDNCSCRFPLRIKSNEYGYYLSNANFQITDTADRNFF